MSGLRGVNLKPVLVIEISPTRPNAFYVFTRITLFWFVKFDEKKGMCKNALMSPVRLYVYMIGKVILLLKKNKEQKIRKNV